MKYIMKQAEPQALAEWKAKADENWQPIYANLRGEEKTAVKNALMKEQGFICCYCERRLTRNDSHIEHFRPQGDHSVDPLDYTNLLCSCQDQLKKGEPRHCGNLKGDWFDPHLLISPLRRDCESRFSFTGDGRIAPAEEDDAAAVETIKQLGLNIPKLNALRAQAIEPFLDDALTVEEFKRFVASYLLKDAAGCFGEFWTTIRYLFGGSVAA